MVHKRTHNPAGQPKPLPGTRPPGADRDPHRLETGKRRLEADDSQGQRGGPELDRDIDPREAERRPDRQSS